MLRYAKEVSPTKDGGLEEVARLERIADYKAFKFPAHLIETQTVAAYRDHRLKSVQSSTVNRELTIISAVIRHAAREWGEPLDQNLVGNVRRPKNPLPRERLITADELKALLAEADKYPPQPVFKCLLVIAAETAMRRGDLAKLQWKHVHTAKKYVHILKGKNGESRDVPLSRRARAALRLLRWSQTGARPSDLVFGYSDPHSITTAFRRVRERSGIVECPLYFGRPFGSE
ncbi:MAG TPA: site-specific integrase [Gammaproteobacteria bacterium]|nr:site-specific integrase [Gammaproteobacteria bacterium]